MECDRARRALSERMDGERPSRHEAAALEQHLLTCARCRAFERGAYRLRERARFGPAPAVPDLVEPIMTAVRAEARPAARVRPLRSPTPRRAPRLAPLAAAALVGALVGSLAVGGLWSPERVATAADVTHGVAEAAARVDAYRASYRIVERNLAPDVPLRELSMELWFQAPERLRLDVTDHTVYPSDAFTPTDLRLVVDGSRWFLRSPSPCPTSACPPRETLVTNRAPFSSAAPVPTDLVVPVTTLSSADGLSAIDRDHLMGRDVVVVRMPFERAAPMFPFLELGGSWRPFFANDRVELVLDASSWFPLRWTVSPAPGRERDRWALRFGLPEERPGLAVLEVEATAVAETASDPSAFAIPATARPIDQGARAVSLPAVPREAGFEPVSPSELEGLRLYRVVVPRRGLDGSRETVLAFVDGLRWLKLAETRSWRGPAPFGPVGPQAQELALPGGGVAYYEPATADHGRRLSIHAPATDVYLESNLSRDELLEVAGSLPLTGLSLPGSWRVRGSTEGTVERVTLEQARAAAPFPLMLPTGVPDGTVLASVELTRLGPTVGVTAYYQGRDLALGSGALRLHLEEATELPASTASALVSVDLGGVPARYAPQESRLEWLRDGVYLSLEAPGLALGDLVAVASSVTVASAVSPGGGP